MRIERVELSGVGPFEDAVLEIPEPTGNGELVLFEGPNGSGKSTLANLAAVCVAHHAQVTLGKVALDPKFSPYSIHFPEDSSLPGLIHQTQPPVVLLLKRKRLPSGALTVRLGHGPKHLLVKLGPDFFSHANAEGADPDSRLDVARPLAEMEFCARGETHRLSWAAFAYQAHQSSAKLETPGPKDLPDPPLKGALSFGASSVAHNLGQLLANIEYERVRASVYAQQGSTPEERDKMAATAEARRESLSRFTQVMTEVLDRKVGIEFPFGKNAPELTFDGDKIPIDLLGEGLRSTIAWLSDLLVRLHQITWRDTVRSPFDQEFWLILDEVDEGLHPTLQARLFPSLRSLFPNARIYATTHSPFVVASVGEGYVFPLRPDKQGRVRGPVEPRKLTPGQSLEWVISEIFEARTGFVDDPTREDLSGHKRDIRQFQKTGTMDWPAFLSRRARLLGLNDEVRTVVFMQESPIAADIRREVERAAPSTDVNAS